MKLFYAVLCITIFMIHNAYAQPGIFDVSFDGDGKVTTAAGTGLDNISEMVLQADGKIVVTGYSSDSTFTDFTVSRYLSNGALDTTFNGNGISHTPYGIYGAISTSIAIQPDGKIVVGGYSEPVSGSDFTVMRYNSNGSLDSSFSADGIATTSIVAVNDQLKTLAIQSDGKIVAGGFSFNGSATDISLVRYRPNGTLDTSFSNNGKVLIPVSGSEGIYDLAILPDGRILTLGMNASGPPGDFQLNRFLTDGSPDTSFNGSGTLILDFSTSYDFGFSMLLQPDGKIIASGYSAGGNGTNNDCAMARINPDGSIDSSFSGDGKLTVDLGAGTDDVILSSALQPDGKIVVAGTVGDFGSSDAFIGRYLPDGTLDSIFSPGGFLIFNFGPASDGLNSILLQPDGKVLVGGYTNNGTNDDFALARYIPGIAQGINDIDGPENVFVYPNPVGKIIRVQYTLHSEDFISIDLFDLQGRKIECFVDHQKRSSGENREQFEISEELNSGVYFICLSSAEGRKTFKLVR